MNKPTLVTTCDKCKRVVVWYDEVKPSLLKGWVSKNGKWTCHKCS